MNIVTIDESVDPDIFLILLFSRRIDTMRQAPDNSCQNSDFPKIFTWQRQSVRGLFILAA